MTNFSNTKSKFGSTTRTIKMDKTFDFSSFLSKTFLEPNPEKFEPTSLAHINDETITKGVLKTMIVAGNGSFSLIPSKYGFSIQSKGDNDSALGPAYPSLANGCFITENPAPKLPRKALETVIEWYRRITNKNGEEAQVVFYWNQYKFETVKDDNGTEHVIKDIPGVHYWADDLFSYTPKQYNHGTLTEVADEDEWYEVFNRNFGMYVETHSHNRMDAFASGTDEDNSANDGFQLVFGRLDTESPIMYSWMTMNRVLRLGMQEHELAKIMEMNPSCRYDTASEKLVYKASDLVFDESLFDEWDKQVIPRPVRPAKATAATYGQTSGYGSYWDDYYGDYYGGYYGTGKNRNYGKGYNGSNNYYASRSKEEKEEFIRYTVTDVLDESLVCQILRAQEENISIERVVDLIEEAFVRGYRAHEKQPVVFSQFNEKKIEAAVRTEARDILETYYEISDN